MKNRQLLLWIAANALGLGMGFVAALQTGMLIEFGFDTELHWKFGTPVGQGSRAYFASLLANLVHGAILGSAQALVLRSLSVRVIPWLLSTMAGFGLFVPVEWSLMAANLWGRIPGPAEPILILLIGCSLAGLLQYHALHRQGIHARRWMLFWIAGLFTSLVPTAFLFMSLESMGVLLSWPMETFLSGFTVAGVAALISGGALDRAHAGRVSLKPDTQDAAV